MTKVAIVGGGVTGMAAADTLSQHGISCTIFEKDGVLGGLAGSFRVDGVYLEKFYHHLFTSDTAMVALINSLGLGDKLEWVPTTHSYYIDRIFRLSTPFDLLRFRHIGFLDRILLGLLYIRTRLIDDWRPLEAISAHDWLVKMAGRRVYEKVWEPLMRAKFGFHADEVAAVWFWNKLKLRGSSRGKQQEERLGYLVGGFGQALEAWDRDLRTRGVEMRLGESVERIPIEHGQATGVLTSNGFESFDHILVTTAPELFTRMAPGLPDDYLARLSSIKYLANICLVMRLDRTLSDTYWLDVGDPSIPITGVIEHTNMQRPETYGGAHLVYISRYLSPEDPHYEMSAEDLLIDYLPHLQKMFRGFSREWVKQVWAWRERYTQPLVGLHYSDRRPAFETPATNLWLSCMAHIYPEDRGMNYAVVYGNRVAERMVEALK
jgi:protoporphyrinogen oxidase